MTMLTILYSVRITYCTSYWLLVVMAMTCDDYVTIVYIYTDT